MKTIFPHHLLKGMRAIKILTPEELEQLHQITHRNDNNSLHKRCQCILYSYYGMQVNDLINVFEVDRRSIYNWMNRWLKGGILALQDKPGRGLKPKLDLSCQDHVEQVKQAYLMYPNNTGQILDHINTVLSKPVSKGTLRRFVKKLSTIKD